MASLIQRIGKLAIRTFKREPVIQINSESFKANYEKLYQLLDSVISDDLKIDEALLADKGEFDSTKMRAPVTYIQLYQDKDVIICVFILERGCRMPLHDHPGMYGLLKVIHGTVTVQSYSLTSSNIDKHSLSEVYPAKKHPLVTVLHTDAPCQVTPDKGNLHEIKSVNGPAAFLDILSPPYGADDRLGIERDCNYYEEIEVNTEAINPPDTLLISLQSIPRDFWCYQAEYKGPTLIGYL